MAVRAGPAFMIGREILTLQLSVVRPFNALVVRGFNFVHERVAVEYLCEGGAISASVRHRELGSCGILHPPGGFFILKFLPHVR